VAVEGKTLVNHQVSSCLLMAINHKLNKRKENHFQKYFGNGGFHPEGDIYYS